VTWLKNPAGSAVLAASKKIAARLFLVTRAESVELFDVDFHAARDLPSKTFGRVKVAGGRMSDSLLVEEGGKISLPEEVREHYGLETETPLRIIETRGGILLVPLGGGPMSEELAHELDEWQALGASGLESFPYEEDAEE
jgi:bifunctional DNA-binding transcriptional regulator/antitoxin component of YhaV-PrlF toxin-antitoxin module